MNVANALKKDLEELEQIIMNSRPPLPPESPEEIERKAASIAKITAPDQALKARIMRIVDMCKRDMPKPKAEVQS